MTTITYEYVTSNTGTVHLTPQIPTGDRAATLCGRYIGGWEMGDETQSGVATTCGRCAQIAFPDRLWTIEKEEV